MLIEYVDGSGNTGPVDARGSLTFSLGCLLVDADHWATAFDELIAFRRRLRDTYRLPMRAEIKANYLIRNSGPLRQLRLAPEERHLIYRAHMRVLDDLPARAFAIVIDKRDKLSTDPHRHLPHSLGTAARAPRTHEHKGEVTAPDHA